MALPQQQLQLDTPRSVNLAACSFLMSIRKPTWQTRRLLHLDLALSDTFQLDDYDRHSLREQPALQPPSIYPTIQNQDGGIRQLDKPRRSALHGIAWMLLEVEGNCQKWKPAGIGVAGGHRGNARPTPAHTGC
ncbi:MAG TPA: hypothetical protein VLM40_08495 [Gemmata sp.]|nr:hypothetical protein [Gemmata sp.]